VLIKSWVEEINKFVSLIHGHDTCLILILNRHVYGGLRVCEYHGRGRETDVKAIANADVVLSTYHTVAGESAKTTSPLFKIHWFRIVLDEGIGHLWNDCEAR
jgi:SNF2 family DNA or RNA helicase